MTTMEILTLLLVVFEALSYIDNRKKNKRPTFESWTLVSNKL